MLAPLVFTVNVIVAVFFSFVNVFSFFYIYLIVDMMIYLNAKKKTTWKEKLERANIWVEVLLNCRPTKQHASLDTAKLGTTAAVRQTRHAF